MTLDTGLDQESLMTPEEAKQQVFNYWNYLQDIARKRFPTDSQMAEEAIDYLLEKLQRNDWQKIREYRGEGFTAFITVVANRLFTDFARKVGDIPYIPVWIQQRGGLWRDAFLLLHKGLNRQEAIEQLWVSAQKLGYEKPAVEEIVLVILSKERIKPRHAHVSLEVEWLDETAANDLPPPEQLADLENNWLLELIFIMIQKLQAVEPQAPLAEDSKMNVWLNKLQQQVCLKSEEFLFLTMVYRDGLSISEAGRRLHLNANQAAGRHRRLLERLQTAFAQAGLTEQLRELITE